MEREGGEGGMRRGEEICYRPGNSEIPRHTYQYTCIYLKYNSKSSISIYKAIILLFKVNVPMVSIFKFVKFLSNLENNACVKFKLHKFS